MNQGGTDTVYIIREERKRRGGEGKDEGRERERERGTYIPGRC